MASTFSAKQVATRIGTDPKTLRKFLRSPASPYQAVGQGKRYEFTPKELEAIRKTFSKWQAKSKARAKAPTPAESKAVIEAAKPANRLDTRRLPAKPLDEVEVLGYNEVEWADPSDADLEEIDDEELDNLMSDLDE